METRAQMSRVAQRRFDRSRVPSATSLQGIVLPIRAQLDFPVVFEGYVWWAVHWPDRQEGQNRSLGVDILWTSRLLGFGEEPVSN